MVLIASCSSSKTDQNLPTNATPVAYSEENSNCLAPGSWFGTANGFHKTPAPNEGHLSPFANNETVSNCDFHQWSWQKFLWLTSEPHGKPLFLDSLDQLTAEGTYITPGQGVILRDTAQASATTDVLISNASISQNGKSYTVYYSIHVNTLMRAQMEEYGYRYLLDSMSLQDSAFAVGSLEVKISWIDARALADTSTYFITKGMINNQSARIALLGMHVVGVVENHPEFVWATFEHDALAPMYDWEQATPDADAPVTSAVNYPFFNKNDSSTITNITTKNGIYQNVFALYKYGVPVHKEIEGQFDVLKYMEASQDGSQNYNNIRVINESVKRQLTDVWNNYHYNGSLWINTAGYNEGLAQARLLDSLSYHLYRSEPGDLTRGSVAGYNITMETYVQAGFAPKSIHGLKINELANCFSCHNPSNNSGNFQSPLLVSHLFSGYISALKGSTIEEIKQEHVDGIIRQFRLQLKDTELQ